MKYMNKYGEIIEGYDNIDDSYTAIDDNHGLKATFTVVVANEDNELLGKEPYFAYPTDEQILYCLLRYTPRYGTTATASVRKTFTLQNSTTPNQ